LAHLRLSGTRYALLHHLLAHVLHVGRHATGMAVRVHARVYGLRLVGSHHDAGVSSECVATDAAPRLVAGRVGKEAEVIQTAAVYWQLDRVGRRRAVPRCIQASTTLRSL